MWFRRDLTFVHHYVRTVGSGYDIRFCKYARKQGICMLFKFYLVLIAPPRDVYKAWLELLRVYRISVHGYRSVLTTR